MRFVLECVVKDTVSQLLWCFSCLLLYTKLQEIALFLIPSGSDMLDIIWYGVLKVVSDGWQISHSEKASRIYKLTIVFRFRRQITLSIIPKASRWVTSFLYIFCLYTVPSCCHIDVYIHAVFWRCSKEKPYYGQAVQVLCYLVLCFQRESLGTTKWAYQNTFSAAAYVFLTKNPMLLHGKCFFF